MRTGAILLCGGMSTRMERDKATLPFGPELMLQRVVRILSEVIAPDNIVVVAAVGQELPELPPLVTIACDRQQQRGPLEGLAVGLKVLSSRIDAAYATSCDVPLLLPAFVQKMFELLSGFDVAVPQDRERIHPLAAVYRCSVLSHVQRLLDADRLRLRSLLDTVSTRIVDVEELRTVDPLLQTLMNLNSPAEYQQALANAGLI